MLPTSSNVTHHHPHFGCRYYLALTTVDLPMQVSALPIKLNTLNNIKTCLFQHQIVAPIIEGTIVYWMANLNAEFHRYIIFLVAMILCYNVSYALGTSVGAAVPSAEVGNAVGP